MIEIGCKVLTLGHAFLIWIVNFAFGAYEQYKIVQKIKATQKTEILLPYRKINVGFLWEPNLPNAKAWKLTVESLNEIIVLAKKQGAKPIIFITPSPASVYGLKFYKPFKKYADIQAEIMDMFKPFALANNVKIIDTTAMLAKAIGEDFIYVRESDCHFNSHGTKVYYKIIRDWIKKEHLLSE
jgi:hypothetical protein